LFVVLFSYGYEICTLMLLDALVLRDLIVFWVFLLTFIFLLFLCSYCTHNYHLLSISIHTKRHTISLLIIIIKCSTIEMWEQILLTILSIIDWGKQTTIGSMNQNFQSVYQKFVFPSFLILVSMFFPSPWRDCKDCRLLIVDCHRKKK
jgi:hypothetical protein